MPPRVGDMTNQVIFDGHSSSRQGSCGSRISPNAHASHLIYALVVQLEIAWKAVFDYFDSVYMSRSKVGSRENASGTEDA